MTPADITKIRAAALAIDKIAQRFPKGSKPDMAIGNLIDHLYAMAAAKEAQLAAHGERVPRADKT